MNTLIVGSDKSQILRYLPDRFLLIDDGPIIDALDIPKRRAVTVFDAAEHSFNPLKDMTYRKARDFLDVLNAAFPEGESTLTKATANFQILEALTQKPKSLSNLVPNTKDTAYAHQTIQRLLLSPVLESVLTRPTNVSFKGTVLARLDRAVLGDFDAFVLGNLLVSQFKGPVVIPDFGFYACPFHIGLVRQDRLIAGINSFEEVPRFRNALLQFRTKVARRAVPADADILATYEGLLPNTNQYHEFIHKSIA